MNIFPSLLVTHVTSWVRTHGIIVPPYLEKTKFHLSQSSLENLLKLTNLRLGKATRQKIGSIKVIKKKRKKKKKKETSLIFKHKKGFSLTHCKC